MTDPSPRPKPVRESDLKPCPFCVDETAAFGAVTYSEKHVQEQEWPQATFHFVSCPACGVSNMGIVGFYTQAEAAEAWNKRAPARDPAQEAQPPAAEPVSDPYKLREALKPFAKAARCAEPDEADDYTLFSSSARHEINLGHLRRAAAALSASPQKVEAIEWTQAQLGWLAEHPMYVACGRPRAGVSFKECGTLYADGRFDPIAPMKPIKLEEGCRLIGVPSDLYLSAHPLERGGSILARLQDAEERNVDHVIIDGEVWHRVQQGQDAKLRLFLAILDKAGGSTSGGDNKHNWINYFCDDAEPLDTFNQASKRKLTRVTHDSDTDESMVYLTDAGRALIVASPPSQEASADTPGKNILGSS